MRRRAPKWDTFNATPRTQSKRRQSPEPCRGSPTLTPFRAERRDKTALHCPSDTHNQGTELAMKVSPTPPSAGRGGKHREAGYGRPVDSGVGAANTVKRPPQQPAQPPIRQLLGAADAQTAHPATSSTAPVRQRLGSANAETTPAGAPAAAADRTQRPDATCEGTNG